MQISRNSKAPKSGRASQAERVCFNHSGIKLEISNQKKTRKSPNMYRFNNALINKPRLKKSQLEL